jgi:hypothetical protein
MAGAVKTVTSGGALTADTSRCTKSAARPDSSRFWAVSGALTETGTQRDARGSAVARDLMIVP